MSFLFTLPRQFAPRSVSLLVGAARCWRRARDTGRAPQPALHAELTPEGLGMLAPVLDGLFVAFEATRGRRFEIAGARDAWLSPDERTLSDSLDGGIVRRAGHAPLGGALDIALFSLIVVTGLEDEAME